MALSSALEHVNVHSNDTFKVTSENTFKVALPEWPGDMYSNNYTSTAAPQRFSAVSKKFKNVSVFNYHASNTLYIGKYYATFSEFQLKSPFLNAFETKEYEFVDLYELGFANGTGVTVAKLTGINEY